MTPFSDHSWAILPPNWAGYGSINQPAAVAGCFFGVLDLRAAALGRYHLNEETLNAR
jgi:hypothetical protein